jgi:hypothetical protein
MKIEFIIHVTDRKEYIQQAVETLFLNKTVPKKNVFISCNSSSKKNHSHIRGIAKKYCITYRRSLATNMIDHLRESVNLSNTTFICLLHDDDYLSPTFVSDIKQLIKKNPRAVAYSCETLFDINGVIHSSSIKTQRDFSLSPLILSLLYLLGRCGPAFPSVVYRVDFIKKEIMRPSRFNNYSDAPILIEACKKNMVISPQKKFFYRMHKSNLSKTEDKTNKKKLKFYLMKKILNYLFKKFSYRYFISNLIYFGGRFIKKNNYSKNIDT